MSKSQILLELKQGFEIINKTQLGHKNHLEYGYSDYKFKCLKPIYEELIRILEKQNETDNYQNHIKQSGKLLGHFVDQFYFMNSLEKVEKASKENKKKFTQTKIDIENQTQQQQLELLKFINSTSTEGNFPLVEACEWRDETLAKCLIDLGANVKLTSSNGQSAINYACSYDLSKTVKILIDKDSTILNGIGNGYTPLHEACFSHNPAVVKVLIEKGANLKASFIGWTPLNIAARYGDVEIFKMLVEKDRSLLKGKDGVSVLHEACSKNKCDENYLTPNKLANKLKMINCLIKQGVSINSKEGYNKDTPLITAAKDGFFDAVKVLKKNKADCRIKNDEYVSGFRCFSNEVFGKTAKVVVQEHLESAKNLKKILVNSQKCNQWEWKEVKEEIEVFSKISDELSTWSDSNYGLPQILGEDIYGEM